MTHLHTLETARWHACGGLHTAQEIAQQPAVWRQLAEQLLALPPAWRATLEATLADPRGQVILTGAGTSAYIGEILADSLEAAWPAQVRAIHSTTLLSHPALFLCAGRPLLVVSFARSGNSPESQGVVELVRAQVPGAQFLNITCSADGQLARATAGRADSMTWLLPPASCDRGFAMTSSFSTMLLAALALLGRPAPAQAAARIGQLAALAAHWLAQQAENWRALGQRSADRIVYLGSGPLEALAREASLKVLELSAGRILAVANSPLGFRHGPKAMLTADTLVFLFSSSEPQARRYQQDLLDELRRDGLAGAVDCIDLEAAWLDDCWRAPVYVLFAQVLALHQSMRLGLTPDNPFPDGSVNRVVQGVTVYPYAAP